MLLKLEFNYLSWWVGGQVGGSKKNEINAILNSVEVKVEVGVELGDFLNFLKRENVFLNA